MMGLAHLVGSVYIHVTMKKYSFTVPGQPIPKARARIVGHAYTPKSTKEHQELVQAYAMKAKIRPITGAVKISCKFFRKNRVRADLDNLVKGCTDPLNGIAWLDDSQIVEEHNYKRYDKNNPRTEMVIEEIAMDLAED